MFQMLGRRSEIGLVPHDPQAMLAYYRDVLGLAIHSETKIATGVNRRFLCGSTVVKHLCLDQPPHLGPQGVMACYGLRQLTLFLPDFDALVARIESVTGIVAKVNEQSGRHYLFTHDPDGNALELSAQTDAQTEGVTVQAGLTVADPARTRRFYQDVLGREFIGVTEWRGREIMTVAWGPAELKFWKGPAGLPTPPPVTGATAGIRYLTALIDDVEDVCAKLGSAGVPMPMPPRAWEGRATIAFITDPDGVLIEFGGPAKPPQAPQSSVA